jgi:hypothetical protein|tara:strand:- start:273 stop:605 length:333 start_codon:yes stop_codon:yes gene_type:complete
MAKGKECIDCIGQKVELGDWCAVTQHNSIYVGKVIKAGSSVTIACSSRDEFIMIDAGLKRARGWHDKKKYMENMFGPGVTPHIKHSPSWARDGKFVKITPTRDMLVKYDS